jgi:hypothetical protein
MNKKGASMPKSLFSPPLVAAFFFAVVGGILYLLKVEGILNLDLSLFEQNTENYTKKFSTDSVNKSRNADSNLRSNEREPTLITNENDGKNSKVDSKNRSLENSSLDSEFHNKTKTPETETTTYVAVANESAILWRTFTQDIPKLYSSPLTANTDEKLSLIGQMSGELDRYYEKDKTTWPQHLQRYSIEFIKMAVDGEREAARALSFQYVRPPLNKTAESLAWAMIANAIAPNDYYYYLCSEEFPRCNENLFIQARTYAKDYIKFYKFKTIE